MTLADTSILSLRIEACPLDIGPIEAWVHEKTHACGATPA